MFRSEPSSMRCLRWREREGLRDLWSENFCFVFVVVFVFCCCFCFFRQWRPFRALTHVSQSILHPMRGWRQGPTYVVLISTAKEWEFSLRVGGRRFPVPKKIVFSSLRVHGWRLSVPESTFPTLSRPTRQSCSERTPMWWSPRITSRVSVV